MTGKISTALPLVPSDEEIMFPGRQHPAFVIAAGVRGRDADNAMWEIIRTAAPNAQRMSPVGPGFLTLDAISQVCAALLPTVRREAPELLTDERLPEGLFAIDPYRVRQIGVGHLAEAVTFAVTRRISRESHHAALVIDRIARTILEIRRRCASFADGLTLVIPGLERWDRPSLRCLYRVVLLAEPDDRLSVVATAGPASVDATEDDPLARIGPARERFFARLTATGMVRATDLPLPAEPAEPEQAPDLPDEHRELLLAMGDALVFQNYERVYYLAWHALDRAADAEERAQAHRLIGIADAQLDEFASAARELALAAGLTGDPAFKAHLHYLRGLIDTKRNYNLDGADAHYANGLAVLDADGAESVEREVERAWLHTGQALVNTLRAKAATDPTERQRLLADAFALEILAFALVRETPGAAPAYLRHNLMANLTFLLEISKRFRDAVGFWRRAFEPYLAGDSKEFRTSFDARMGVLLAKAGERDRSAAVLEEARTRCQASGDRFGEEELCLKLGFVYAAAGELERAYHAYRDGLRIAHGLREADICLEALSGMLWSLAELGATEEFDALRCAVLRALPGTTVAKRLGAITDGEALTQALATAGIARPVPSPTLRAYIPGVDLEGTPTQDFNRYLIWSEGALPAALCGHRDQPMNSRGCP